MDFKKVKISTTVPTENAEDSRAALGKAGAGVFGNYTFCSFSVIGKGRFKPNEKAHPILVKQINWKLLKRNKSKLSAIEVMLARL
jgi:hypothetical protein